MTQELRVELRASFLKGEINDVEDLDLSLDFEGITLKLRECALHQPGIDFQKDEEILALESELLSFQEDILEKTAKVKIASDKSFEVMKNLWKSANEFKFEADLNLIDQLALNLFQYTEQKI